MLLKFLKLSELKKKLSYNFFVTNLEFFNLEKHILSPTKKKSRNFDLSLVGRVRVDPAVLYDD